MIWNDKEIIKIIENQTIGIKELNEAVSTLGVITKRIDEDYKKRIGDLEFNGSTMFELLGKFNDKGVVVEKRINEVSETVYSLNKTTNSKINDMELRLRDELEFSLRGLIKTIDKRLEDLGEKKGIVVDLLKRIAKLEGPDVST